MSTRGTKNEDVGREWCRTLATTLALRDMEAVAEDEAVWEAATHTTMKVPVELVPVFRETIAKRRAD